MKNLMIAAATAATLSAATAASANDLAFIGGIEYATKAEVFETTVGLEYAVNRFTLTPLLTLNGSAGDFDMRTIELTVDYTVSSSVNLYVTIDGDRDFNHNETTLGVAFRF
jgi:hypothetical protein